MRLFNHREHREHRGFTEVFRLIPSTWRGSFPREGKAAIQKLDCFAAHAMTLFFLKGEKEAIKIKFIKRQDEPEILLLPNVETEKQFNGRNRIFFIGMALLYFALLLVAGYAANYKAAVS